MRKLRQHQRLQLETLVEGRTHSSALTFIGFCYANKLPCLAAPHNKCHFVIFIDRANKWLYIYLGSPSRRFGRFFDKFSC